MTRDEVIKGLERCMGKVTCTGCPLECMEDDACALTLLQEAVALLKAELKRGQWYGETGILLKCSLCGAEMADMHVFGELCPKSWARLNYCPNCGARMEVCEQ